MEDYLGSFSKPTIQKSESSVDSDRMFSSCVRDAIQIHKILNNTNTYDIAPAEAFLSALKKLSRKAMPKITFYSDSVKAKVLYNRREFIIDYDYEEVYSVFVSTFDGGKLLMKDGNVNNLLKILDSF